jgi:hypothetical protein
MVSFPQLLCQMLEEQSLLTHYRWEDVYKFSSDMLMVNVAVVESFRMATLRNIPSHTFAFIMIFFPTFTTLQLLLSPSLFGKLSDHDFSHNILIFLLFL